MHGTAILFSRNEIYWGWEGGGREGILSFRTEDIHGSELAGGKINISASLVLINCVFRAPWTPSIGQDFKGIHKRISSATKETSPSLHITLHHTHGRIHKLQFSCTCFRSMLLDENVKLLP